MPEGDMGGADGWQERCCAHVRGCGCPHQGRRRSEGPEPCGAWLPSGRCRWSGRRTPRGPAPARAGWQGLAWIPRRLGPLAGRLLAGAIRPARSPSRPWASLPPLGPAAPFASSRCICSMPPASCWDQPIRIQHYMRIASQRAVLCNYVTHE